jgi:hypothetical protein
MATASLNGNALRGEIGVSGLRHWDGVTDEELLRELRGPRGVRVYREMSENDPVIGGMLFAIEQSARQVTWAVKPPPKLAEDPQALRLADFVSGCLFDDMSCTFQDLATETLSMLRYGWSFFEIVYKQRLGPRDDPAARSRFTDGKLGWRKWAIRSQDTLSHWRLDAEGGVQALVQQDPNGPGLYTIPIQKGLLFRTSTYKNNPEGRSILRNAYRPWYFKKKIEEIEGIGIERDLAGYPVFKVAENGPDLWNEDDPQAVKLMARLQRIVKSIRRDQQEGLILPDWLAFELVSTGGRRSFDTSGIITRWDQRICMVTLADFILLGHDKMGSFALSSDKTHLFAVALGGYLDTIAEVANRYAIPRLLELNGEPLALQPRLEHGDIEARSLAELGQYAAALAREGLIEPDRRLERNLRERAEMPAAEHQGPMPPPLSKQPAPGAGGASPPEGA